MPKPENRYPNNVSGFEHIWELDMLNLSKKTGKSIPRTYILVLLTYELSFFWIECHSSEIRGLCSI